LKTGTDGGFLISLFLFLSLLFSLLKCVVL
jgi:hypothetical protein